MLIYENSNIKKNNENGFDGDMIKENNPCFSCGACCEYFRVSFYQGELKSVGGIVPDNLVIPITPFRVAMKGTEFGCGKCVALKNDDKYGKICSIYENRPSVCRSFLVWDEDGNPNPDCQRLRAQKGLSLLEKNS